MRRLIRWAFYLFVILVVLFVAGVLLLNTIVKQVMVSRLRANTGMDVRIGEIDVGLLSPTVTIENVKFYNKADFGGAVFIDMPELHLEYDPWALRSHKLHFRLVRLNLAELNLVQDKSGRSNVQDLDRKNRPQSQGRSSDDLQFTGIDTLNLTLGKFRRVDLASGRGQEIEFGMKDQISHNVKSEADLANLNGLLAIRARSNSTSNAPPFDLALLLKNLTGL
jgi:uncharacterized protein involved in outer membrane biogenesis